MVGRRDAENWRVGFAKQARAEFSAWRELEANERVADCTKLHLLQMACEKLVKAHLCASGSDPYVIQHSHAYIAKNLPIIARQQFSMLFGVAPRRVDARMRQVKLLAREIELLHPDVDDGGRRPDNCEYPWRDESGTVRVPAECAFANLHLLTVPAGRMMVKLVEFAIRRLIDPDS